MHILFVTGEYPPMTGGVGAYTQELARALCSLGAHVSVLTSTEVQPAPSANPHITVLPVVRRWGAGLWRTAASLADAAQADWIHVQYQTGAFRGNPSINLAPERWRRSGRSALRVAWTYHDLLPPYLFPKAGSRLRDWVTTRPAHTSDLTIVTNEGDRLRLTGSVRNLHSVPIGSNIQGASLNDEQRSIVRQRYGYTKDEPVIAYFGFLNRSKGAITLIRTLYHLSCLGDDTSLLLIGDPLGALDPTNRAYLESVKTLIGELGLSSRVRWTGPLADADVAAALNAIDVLVLPYEDGASLRRGTLMAGLANGCAIVTTLPQAPLPELVDGRDLLYVQASDPIATAEAARTLLNHPAKAAELRASARARSAAFTWQNIAEQHLSLYAGPF